jgi:hypothetical protein
MNKSDRRAYQSQQSPRSQENDAMSNVEQPTRADGAAYRQGWRAGLALGALAVAVSAFINVLSIEKSLLAIALALVALRGADAGPARKRGRLALGIAAAHLALAAFVLVVFHDKLARLLSLMQSLG